MIRRLIILLLIVGCVFGDTIVVKKETKDKDGSLKTYNSETMGEYVGILDAKAYLRTPDGNLKEFNCSDVIVIFDNERKPIEYDCSTNTFIPNTLTELDVDEIYETPYLGAICIAFGGYLLHTYLDDPFCISNECESLDDYKKYTDKKQLQWRAGIIFISLGGILVALGI